MPLTPTTVTVASRIMLPAYVVYTAAFGFVYLTDPLNNLGQVHALTFPRIVMGGTMMPWGFIFLGLSALMASALVIHTRVWFAFALCMCAVAQLMWAAMYAVSIHLDPGTSPLAPVNPLFVVACCVASTASLLRGEV